MTGLTTCDFDSPGRALANPERLCLGAALVKPQHDGEL